MEMRRVEEKRDLEKAKLLATIASTEEKLVNALYSETALIRHP